MKARIHWNKFKRKWTVHTYKSCSHSDFILIKGGWETEVKPLKKANPRGFIVCDSEQILIDFKGVGIDLIKKEKLFYDKKLVQFSITQGNNLICDSSGCWIVDMEI